MYNILGSKIQYNSSYNDLLIPAYILIKNKYYYIPIYFQPLINTQAVNAFKSRPQDNDVVPSTRYHVSTR